MSIVKSNSEIELIRESAQLVSKTLGMLAIEIKPECLNKLFGVNTIKSKSFSSFNVWWKKYHNKNCW